MKRCISALYRRYGVFSSFARDSLRMCTYIAYLFRKSNYFTIEKQNIAYTI